jgi:hypothetical protein
MDIRFTADIDFLVRPTFANAELVIKTLRDFGFSGLQITPEDLARPDQILQLGVKPTGLMSLHRSRASPLMKPGPAGSPDR